MDSFFGNTYTGKPFAFFDAAHIGALLAIFLLNIFYCATGSRMNPSGAKFA